MKRLPPSLALATLLLVAPAPAHATWSHDPMNGNNPVCVSTTGKNTRVMAADGLGGTLYAWEVWAPSGMDLDLHVQRLDAQGNALWGVAGSAAVDAPRYQSFPGIVPDGTGGMILTWTHDENYATSSYDIRAMRIDSAGASVWTADVCVAPGQQGAPVVTTDGAGGAIITWQDSRGGMPHIYAQRVSRGGAVLWASDGVAICTASPFQDRPVIRADGAGGAWIAWTAIYQASYHLYLQHVDGNGDPLFQADGRAISDINSALPVTNRDPVMAPDGQGGIFLCWSFDDGIGGWGDLYGQQLRLDGSFASGSQTGFPIVTGMRAGSMTVCSDLQGGAFVVWADSRTVDTPHLYGQHLGPGGTLGWEADGAALTSGSGSEMEPVVIPDGQGGAFLAWSDQRVTNGDLDVYAQHVNGDGARAWPLRGLAVTRASGFQNTPMLVSDGERGFVAAWYDARNPGWYGDIFAQRVDGYGILGEPAPVGLSVRDVMNDQGGRVKLSWTGSYLDTIPTFGVAEYRLWRSVPAARAAALSARRCATRDAAEAFATGRVFVRSFGATEYAWEPAGSVPAAGLDAYSFLATTTSDSLPASNPCTVFMVEARAGTGLTSAHWFSAPDSGYSVDNLVPAAPSLLTGQFVAGSTSLHWQPNAEADLAGYRIYRGSTEGFMPEPSACVATPGDTGYVDACGVNAYYKLTAVDRHGNESAAASLSPPQAPDGGVPPASQFAFSRPQPNPATTSATLRFDLPAAGNVQLSVYDATGRNVRTLVSGSLGAGAQSVTWNLADASGHGMPAGLYFAHLVTPAGVRVQRLVLTP